MRYVLAFAFGILPAVLLGQGRPTPPDNTADVYWNVTPVPTQLKLKLSTTVIPNPTSLSNEINLMQNGVNNAATLSILSGSQNRLDVNQVNTRNSVDAVLSGSNNAVILNQSGVNNTILFGLNGSNNRFMLSQDGGDYLKMQGLDQSNARIEISQGAGHNSLTIDNSTLFKDATGTGIPSLRIEQSGGATATIQSGHFFTN